MEYYIIEFVYQRKQYYFIWETNEIDRFLTDNNKILFWKQKRDVMDFSKINKLENDTTIVILLSFEIL